GGLCIGIPNNAAYQPCSNANCRTADGYAASAYSPAQTGTIGSSGGSLTVTSGGGTAMSVGDYIQMDNEKMKITGGGGTSWNVSRAELSTAQAAHTNKAIQYIVGSPDVTLTSGTYIMAGGGFRVCRAAKLTAPNVTIYNTNDDAGGSPLDQVQINTIGSVTLGPQLTGLYQGLTIYQPAAEGMSGYTVGSSAGTLAAAISSSQK